VESAMLTGHADGSVAVAGHTFIRKVVGEVPVTCTRAVITAPPAADTPAATTSGRRVMTVGDPFSASRESATDPSALTRSLAWYSRFESTRRPMTLRYEPLPVASLSVARVTRISLSLDDTAGSTAASVSPAFAVIEATPPATEYLVATPVTAQAPPRSAVPQPAAAVRAKLSAANGSFAGGATSTSFPVDPVTPPSSTTLSTIRYDPAAA